MNVYAVKCDDCKVTIRETEDVRESYAGGTCDKCGKRYIGTPNGHSQWCRAVPQTAIRKTIIT